MKFIKTINEYLNPEKNIYVSFILNDIIKKININDEFDFEFYDTYIWGSYLNNDEFTDKKKYDIYKLVYKTNLKSIKNNVLLVLDFKEDGHEIAIAAKNIYTYRIKPNRYVYHMTENQNVESILKDGLIPRDSSKWVLEDPNLEYPPSIFASNSNDANFYNSNRYTKLKIDTSLLKNKWFHDLNMFHEFSKSYNKYIMTFEAIPVEAISVCE